MPLATPPRLALCRTPAWDEAQPEGHAVLREAADALAAAGAVILEAELPPEAAAAGDIQRRLAAFEGPRNHAPELYRHADLLSPRLCEDRIAAGRAIGLAEFRAARREAEHARLAAAAWASSFDAVLTLPAPGEAPRGLARTGSAIFNAPWTLLYVPCLTLPWAKGPNGLPVGIQLVGRRHGDRRLLEIGAWVEERLGGGR
jgi:Asp-tRNA(Asn)/Glu-tRNA(Gln) amidotransferase A subunit family amidase